MSQTDLKLLTCAFMLIDHIGYFWFPDCEPLRWIGRLAFPLFAWFVAEGCLYTRSRLRYFGRVAALGVLCQIVYSAEELLGGGLRTVYLSSLFSFCLSMPLCFLLLEVRRAVEKKQTRRAVGFGALLVLGFGGAAALCCLGDRLPLPIVIDYGLGGILLPLSALFAVRKTPRLAGFGVGLVLFNLLMMGSMPYTWCSMLTLVLLAAYNGERGRKVSKWFFYAFYPLHMALVYLLQPLFY